MTPTDLSEPRSLERSSRICQQQSSIRITSPRTFPSHGALEIEPFSEFWDQRHRVFERMRKYGGSFMASFADTLSYADPSMAFKLYHLDSEITRQICIYCDGGIFDDAA